MKTMSKLIQRLLLNACLLTFLVIPVSVMARSTPVEVQNFPEVQAVEDVHHPANQSCHWDEYRRSEISGSTSLAIGVSTEFVPEDKKLAIEHVSYKVSSAGFEGAPTANLDILLTWNKQICATEVCR
ncbi:hypothetical protein [uncultured Desulfobacter sp.]|uniref:hypothetical protein n=1 Tax=uncultured Desulfobacter sp. TaxID=240139 RepID=UPI00374903EF